jgi:transcriptional regulator of acetoin/glycerol metabolism
MELLYRYRWPGIVRELISAVERLAAKVGGGRIITADLVRREVDFGRKSALAPCHVDRFHALRDGETIMDYLRRSNGRTAAERFFGAKPRDLFGWLVDRLDVPARPAAKRSNNGRKAA